MTPPEKEKILAALLNDEITFSQAAKQLDVSDKKLEELIDNFTLIPSFKTIIKVSEFEKKSIEHINEVIQKHSSLRHPGKIKCHFSVESIPITSFNKIPKSFKTTYAMGSTIFDVNVNTPIVQFANSGLYPTSSQQLKKFPSSKSHQTGHGMNVEFQEVIRQCS